MSARQKKRAKSTGSTSGGSGSGGSSGGSGGAALSEPLQQCHSILKFLQSRQDASPFLEPVDWEFYGLTDYPEIIKNPMDLGTIETKLLEGKYSSPAAFSADVRLVWKNAMTYNRPDSDIYDTADKLGKLFEKKFATISKSPTKKSRKEEGSSSSSGGGEVREVSRADRLKLSQAVNQLSGEDLGTLVEIIQKECPEALNEEDDDEVEIEINNIDAKTLHQLNQFCAQCIANNNKKKK